MWGWLRRLFCCAPGPSAIDVYEFEDKDPVEDSADRGHLRSTGTSNASTISQVPLVDGVPLKPSTAAIPIIRERGNFEDATTLSNLISPPSLPPSVPPHTPGIVPSTNSLPRVNRPSQPPSLMIPPPTSVSQAVSSADGVKGSTPQTVIDSGIEIGGTPALNRFGAHPTPLIPESDTRGDQRTMPDDIPEHDTVQPVEIHPAADQRESTPIDTLACLSSKLSLLELELPPTAGQATLDHSEHHGQSMALPAQTCQYPSGLQGITRSTCTAAPPNSNLIHDGYTSVPPSAGAERETTSRHRIQQAHTGRSENKADPPAYPSPPPSPPLIDPSSWLMPAAPSPETGLGVDNHPEDNPSILCGFPGFKGTAEFPHTLPKGGLEVGNNSRCIPSTSFSRSEIGHSRSGHSRTTANPLPRPVLPPSLPSPPEEPIQLPSYFPPSDLDRGGLSSGGSSESRPGIVVSPSSHTEPPRLCSATSSRYPLQDGLWHPCAPPTGPPTSHSESRSSLEAVDAQDYTKPHVKYLNEGTTSSLHVEAHTAHVGIPPHIIPPLLEHAAESSGGDDPGYGPPHLHRSIPAMGCVTPLPPSQIPMPTVPVSFDTHAQNLTVGFMGTIVAGGSVTIRPRMIINSNQDPGWQLLQAHVAPNAIHTSPAVRSTGKCDPGTRTKVLTRINNWTETTIPGPDVLCMTGAAGSGKSSIALSVAEECERNHKLGGTFFFSSADDTRNNCSRFVATMAYQLASHSNTLREAISDAANDKGRLIFEASLQVQATELIFKPLQQEGTIPASWIVLVDGVDECAEKERDDLIALLTQTFLEGGTFFRVLIIGRLDVALHSALRPGGGLDGSAHIRLSDDKEFDATDDIRRTLWTQLSNLIGSQRVTEEDVEVLVEAASGQYIFPATVIKHVKEGRRDAPYSRLKAIRSWISNGKSASRGPNPLSALDVLYQNILATAVAEYTKASHEDAAEQKQDPLTLALQGFALLEVSTPLSRLESECDLVYDSLLGLPEGGFNSVVCDLRALVRVREPTEIGRVIQFYHQCLGHL